MAEMTYNSVREDLAIPEYGRAIHQMVAHALSLTDREERTKCAAAIVSVMGNVVPQEGEGEDVQKKLWDQLHIMADYQLDVDAPFEQPAREERSKAPGRMAYPDEKSRLGHYGKLTRELVSKALEYPEGEERNVLIVTIANLMKRHFLTWNRGTVENAFIAEQIKELSGGKLTLPEDAELVSSAEILKSKRKTSDALDRRRPGGGKKKR